MYPMNKEEICQRLVDVCNSLNSLTVTGVQNAALVAGCHSVLQETAAYLLSCDIIPPDKKREPPENGGK